MVGEHEDPIGLCSFINNSFNDYHERIMRDESKAKFVDLIGIIKVVLILPIIFSVIFIVFSRRKR